MSETWLGTSYSNSLLHIPNYRVYRQDMISSWGSGVCFYVREANIIAHAFDSGKKHHEGYTLTSIAHHIWLRKQPAKFVSWFWSLLRDCLDDTTNHNVSDLIILGNLNVNALSPTPATQFSCFSQFLSDMQLMNFINELTRPLSYSCLDLILVPVTMAPGVHMDNTTVNLMTALETITRIPVTLLLLLLLLLLLIHDGHGQ